MMDWASDNLEDILPLEELGDDMQIDMQIHSSAPSTDRSQDLRGPAGLRS